MLVKEQTTALLCTHVYHTECIEAYCTARHKDIVSIPCPLCKRAGLSLVPDDCSLSDANDTDPEFDDVIVMPAPGAAASSSGVPPPEPRIVDTGLPPPTEANESEDEEAEAAEEPVHDREPAVTPKAKANAKAETKSKAKARAETKSKAKAAAKAEAAPVDEPGGAVEPTPAATTAIALLPTPKAPEFQVAQLFQGLAMCDTCQAYQPFDKVRVRSKCQQIFRCNACHSKQCTLRRAFGRWPTETFTGLDQDKQTAFWQSLDSLSGRKMIAKVSETLSNYEESAEVFYDGGEYLPLSASFGNSDLRRRVRKQRGALTNR